MSCFKTKQKRSLGEAIYRFEVAKAAMKSEVSTYGVHLDFLRKLFFKTRL